MLQENIEHALISPFAGIVLLFHQYLYTRNTSLCMCFEFKSHRARPRWFAVYQCRAQKWVVRYFILCLTFGPCS